MAKNDKSNLQMNYSLNLDEIMKFVFENENNRNTDSEISEFYETMIKPFSFVKRQEFLISRFKSECLRLLLISSTRILASICNNYLAL